MTTKQYWRLSIVLFGPLLLLGFLVFAVLMPYDRYIYVLCAPAITFENCREVGPPDGSFYKGIESEYNAWFDIRHTEAEALSSTISLNFRGSERPIIAAKIESIHPYRDYNDEVLSEINLLKNQSGLIILGVITGYKSFVGKKFILYCNSLQFYNDNRDLFSSQCFGKNWEATVHYTVQDDFTKNSLDQLSSEIILKIKDARSNYLIYQLIYYPIFIYIFLLISALFWLFKRAYIFIKAGE